VRKMFEIHRRPNLQRKIGGIADISSVQQLGQAQLIEGHRALTGRARALQ